MRWYIAVARGFGYVLNLNTALVILLAARLFLTSLRSSPLHWILPLDKAFPMIHIVVGYVIAISVLFHAGFHMAWICGWNTWERGLWGFTMSAVTGWALFAVFLVMFIMSRPTIRKNYFRAFYITHLVGAFLFFGLLVFHGMYRRKPETYKYIVGPLVIYLIDRIIRKLKVATVDLHLTHENSIFIDDQVLQLRLRTPFSFKPGQYAEVLIPSINHEWHPFTIASAPHEEHMSFYIKKLGNWTEKLHAEFRRRLDRETNAPLRVKVRGPFGAPCQHVNGYERVVLVSGGIGATPFASACKHLHHLQTTTEETARQLPPPPSKEAELRVDAAISALYDISVTPEKEPESTRTSIDTETTATTSQEQDASRRLYVANMLRLTSTNRNSVDFMKRNADPFSTDFTSISMDGDASSESETQTSMSSSSILKPAAVAKSKDSGMKMPWLKYNRPVRQKSAKLSNSRSRLLAFLHTTRVYLFLVSILLVRVLLISLGILLKYKHFNMGSTADTTGSWLVATDAALAIIFLLILPTTILLEFSFMRARYFSTVGRCIDFFVFLPLTTVVTALQIYIWIADPVASEVRILVQYVVFLPVLFFLLCYRMYRTIGSRRLLQDRASNTHNRQVPLADFVWTTPNTDGDAWLRNELTPLLSPDEPTEVGLHRYVTREKNVDSSDCPAIKTQGGRPNWDEVFASIARETPSNSVVCVFFCGPHPMGSAVQKSLRAVEQATHLRAAYLNGSEQNVKTDLRISQEELTRLRERGGNVRFVYREENFG